MITTQIKPEIFTIFSNEIQGRLDPYFYRPEFRELEEKLKNSKMEIKKLSEIAKIKGGKRIPLGKTFSDKKTEYPYLRVTDFNQNSINLNNLKYISKEVFDKIQNYTISTKDIYISNAGTIGLVGIIPEELNNKSLTENAGKITNINTNKIEQKFLMYVLDSKISKKQIDRELLVVGVPKLSLERISNLKIPIPPKEIQKQIIALMDNAYNLKKQNEEKAKELINGIDDFVLEKLGIKMPKIEEKMCFVINSKEAEKNRIDAEFHQKKYKIIVKALENGKYELQKIKDVCKKINSGSTPKAKGENYLEQGENYFIRISDFDDFKVDLTNALFINDETYNKELKRSQLQKGDILFGIAGTIGVTALFDCEVKANINQAIAILRVKTEKLFNEYLLYILNSKIIKFYSEKNKRPVGVPNMNLEELSNLKIPVPPLEIQEEIAKEVKSRLQKAKELKKSAIENLQKVKEKVEKILLD